MQRLVCWDRYYLYLRIIVSVSSSFTTLHDTHVGYMHHTFHFPLLPRPLSLPLPLLLPRPCPHPHPLPLHRNLTSSLAPLSSDSFRVSTTSFISSQFLPASPADCVAQRPARHNPIYARGPDEREKERERERERELCVLVLVCLCLCLCVCVYVCVCVCVAGLRLLFKMFLRGQTRPRPRRDHIPRRLLASAVYN